MKALVLQEYNRLVYEDVSPPAIGSDDVLIRVETCGICGSDVHGLDGSTGRRRPPVIMGHEAAGTIVELGRDVNDWAVGDRVTFDSTIYCGRCWYCKQGLVNLCDDRRVLGVSCEEYRRDGAFAEFISVPQRILYRLPEEMSFQQAAMVEALSVAMHAMGRIPVAPNGTAVVLGAGMIGLLIVQVLHANGYESILVTDIDKHRLSLAEEFGATATVNPNQDDIVEEAKKSTNGRGADIAFDAVGIESTLTTAVDSLRKGGSLVLVGNLNPSINLPLQKVVTRQLTLAGSCASCGEYPTCLEWIAKRKVNVDALISAIVPLSDGQVWFERLAKGNDKLMKVILTP